MRNTVRVNGGTVVNGEPCKLSVEIPAGMSGRKLAAWRKKHAPAIIAAIESEQLPAEIEGTSNDDPY